MQVTILEKTGKAGQQITILRDGAEITGIMDGEDLGTAWTGILKLHTPQGNVTHYLNFSDEDIRIGLSSDDVAQIKAAFAERRAREEIASRLQSALESWSYERNRDDGGTGLRFARAKKYEDEGKVAEAELRAFDLAHPELKAEIDAERAVEIADKIRRAENA